MILPGSIVLNKLSTPLGSMTACIAHDALCLLEFSDRRMLPTQLKIIQNRLKKNIVEGDHPLFERVQDQVSLYMQGKLTHFDVPLLMPGTPFQQRVWQALLEIPYGQTISYLTLANRLGNALAIRAVAQANGYNRLAIVVPCHRVIGSDGELTGYGGGLTRKRFLLELEGYKQPGKQLMLFDESD
jgi:AraC family transcriptional regulator of adaptative response/methylated-DNA-[protein]-cysteine methyltransferase